MPDTMREGPTGALEESVTFVLKMTDNAARQGALSLWTIYNKPVDYPHGIIARRHLIPGGPTECMLIAPLEDLREIFHAAGLVCVVRSDNDDVKIVETWI
jgi:hypothetical protein